MARLRSKCKADDSAGSTRVGERMAEGVLTSQDPVSRQEVTKTTTRMYEDGSGTFNIRRGREDITIRWSDERGPGFDDIEIHANFNGQEGTLVRSNLPVPVPEVNDGN